jgi:hypothetical protein
MTFEKGDVVELRPPISKEWVGTIGIVESSTEISSQVTIVTSSYPPARLCGPWSCTNDWLKLLTKLDKEGQ